jgi:hypothetical protein
VPTTTAAVLRLVTPTAETARARYWRLRRASNLALLSWLREKPHPDDITDEITASVSVLRQLMRLMGSTP